jgi:hypothetical protein
VSDTIMVVIDKLAFEGPKGGPDRGFCIKAFYLSEPSGDALVEITRDGQPYRRFLYPAYKVWNLAAHFSDIVTGEIDGSFAGYSLAGWTGFIVIMPRSMANPQNPS